MARSRSEHLRLGGAQDRSPAGEAGCGATIDGEGQPAEPAVRGQVAVEHAGDGDGAVPAWKTCSAPEKIDRDRGEVGGEVLGRQAAARSVDEEVEQLVAPSGVPAEQEPAAAEAGQTGFGDGGREACGDGGVHGVAARAQDGHGGVTAWLVTGRRRPPVAVHRRARLPVPERDRPALPQVTRSAHRTVANPYGSSGGSRCRTGGVARTSVRRAALRRPVRSRETDAGRTAGRGGWTTRSSWREPGL